MGYPNHEFEKVGKLLTEIPDIAVVELNLKDEFLVIACDGLWEVFENEQVIKFIRLKLSTHGNVRRAAFELTQEAIKRLSSDNVTVIILTLN